MEKNTCISIVTVTFNALDDIKTTANSVWAQQLDDIEHIIVDGGSTDGTREWLLQQKSNIVQWCSEKDEGIYEAMNKGVSMYNGDWGCFMNAGDTFANSETLIQIKDHLKNNEIDIIYGSVNVIKNFGKVTVDPQELEQLNRKMVFCHQAALSRRKLLKEHPFNLRYRLGADYDFFRWCYLTGKRFKKVPFTLANYEAEDGATSKHRLRVLRECGEISGRNRTVIDTLEFLGKCFEVMFNKLYRSFIPSSIVEKLRARNYQRLKGQRRHF